ncbi:MAG: hypothetical protein K8I02_06465, partial [Candidatus Methylomirabilis sp.]|nr:hypothetical protein [Deltaproteobacteria bacterium]
MLGDLFQISVLIKGANLLSGPVRQAMKDLKDLQSLADRGRELQELGTRYTVAGALAQGASRQLMGALLEPISAFAELEDAETRARIAYMTAGGTDPLFPKIAAEARELGNLLPGTNADFFRMGAALKELGISSEVIAEGGLRATAYLRALLKDVGPEQAAEFTATFSRSLGVAEDDFVEFVDLIQRAKFGFGLDPG